MSDALQDYCHFGKSTSSIDLEELSSHLIGVDVVGCAGVE